MENECNEMKSRDTLMIWNDIPKEGQRKLLYSSKGNPKEI